MGGRALFGVAAGVALAAVFVRRYRRALTDRTPPPSAGDRAGFPIPPGDKTVVDSVCVYPVKALRGARHARVDLDAYGVKGDRRFMLYVDGPAPRFITQRQMPHLALMEAELVTGPGGREELVLRWRAPMSRAERLGLAAILPAATMHLQVPVNATGMRRVRVGIWSDEVETVDMGARVALWVSFWLGRRVRLCWTGDAFHRPVDARYTPDIALRGGKDLPQVSFGDGYPILLAGTASLQDLNRRLVAAGAEPVPMDRFRPNVVVHTTQPFDEDTWKRIRIGQVEYAVVKGCGRCKVPTIDQATGKAAPAPAASTSGLAEPVLTLSQYRKHGDDFYFGQNIIPLTTAGELAEGDEVVVLERGEPTWDSHAVPRE